MADTDIASVAVELEGRERKTLPVFSSFPGPWTTLTFLVAVLVAAPVLVVLAYLAVPTGEVWRHLVETVLARYVANSIGLMGLTAFGTLVIGVSTAWLVTMCRFPGHRQFEWALLLPLAMPAYVIAYTYTGLLEFAGPVQTSLRALTGWSKADYWFPEIRSLGGAAAMLTLVLYPYVYLLARAAFLEQSVCVLEVSRTLGCGPWKSFRTVALPLARPAIAGGLALVCMEALSDFGTVQYFAVDTFTTGIYRTWFGLQQPAAAAQLGAVLMLFAVGLIAIERTSRGKGRFGHSTTRMRPLPRFPLHGLRGAAAMVACALPLILGFLLPASVLAVWAFESAHSSFDAAFFTIARNSFVLAAIAAVLATIVAVLLVYGLRLRPSKATGWAVRVAGMGYAVPGSVIAVGVLLASTTLDNGIDSWAIRTFGVSTGLLLTGSITAVIYAYLVRFLAVSYNAVDASLAKVTPHMDGAARTLGHGPLSTLRRVHLPLIRGSLLSATLLVFVDVMKELPATLIMRPFNFDTLAIRTYQLAADERLRDAAAPGLTVALVGVLPVILLSRGIAKSRPGSSR